MCLEKNKERCPVTMSWIWRPAKYVHYFLENILHYNFWIKHYEKSSYHRRLCRTFQIDIMITIDNCWARRKSSAPVLIIISWPSRPAWKEKDVSYTKPNNLRVQLQRINEVNKEPPVSKLVDLCSHTSNIRLDWTRELPSNNIYLSWGQDLFYSSAWAIDK